MFKRILHMSLALMLGVGAAAANADQFKLLNQSELQLKFQELHVLEGVIVEQNFLCRSGWTITREYTLNWRGCLGGLPYACTETHQVVEQCINGRFVQVSDVVIERECDYTYDGTSCPVDELPWPR